jgi:spermidine synthase
MKIKKLLLITFMISGMTALIYEIIWSRQLQLIFGSTIYAVSTILTTFFAGFALGSFLFRNIADKSKNALNILILLELGIGLYGLLTLILFNLLTPIYLALGSPLLQFTILFLIIIIPTTLFGATWPVMNKIFVDKEKLGENIGFLYFFNSFGSFLGPFIAGFILIPLFGLRTTSLIASSLNILVGVFVFFYVKMGVKHE